MCRNIRTLYNFEPPATEDEAASASLQFVRKISGFTKPSKANEEAFEEAIAEIGARPDGAGTEMTIQPAGVTTALSSGC